MALERAVTTANFAEEEKTVTCAISCKGGGEEDKSEDCFLIALFLIIAISAAILGAYLSVVFY